MSISRFSSSGVPTNLAYLWREQMKEDEWIFSGFSRENVDEPLDALVQNQDGRDEINRGMSDAFLLLSKALSYYPIAQRLTHEFTLRGSCSYAYEFHLPTNRIISLGKPSKTRLTENEGAEVVYSKSSSSLDFFDIATVSFDSEARIEEISVRFLLDDCPAGFVDDEQLEIKPLTIETDGETLTITGHASLFASPALQYESDVIVLDESDSNNFVSHVHIYRESVDYTIHAELYHPDKVTLLDTLDVEIIDDNFALCQIAGYATSYANVVLRVYAYSGASLVYNAVDVQMAYAMTRLCNVLMPEYPRNITNQVFENFAKDREEIETIEAQQALKVFGSIRRGAIQAWQIAKSRRLRTWGA